MNAGQLISWMQTRCPAGVLKPGWSWYTVLNKAGLDFYNAHSWQFAERATDTIVGVAGKDRVDLPADFVAPVSVESVDLGRDMVVVLGASAFNALASSNQLGTTGKWYLCFDDAEDQRTLAEFIRPTARIWPVPTTSGSPQVRLSYERGWRTILEDAAGHVPNIRPHCLSVFMDFCEMAAWEALFDTQPPHMQAKAARLAALIEKDELNTASVTVRGGVARRDEDDDEYTFANDLTT